MPNSNSNSKITITGTCSEATELRPLVEEIITEDPRFVGLSRYLGSVYIYWSREIETACAGHGFIFFNPDFWDSIPDETRKTVLAHEVWHLILRHLERGKTCDPVQHNIAADHVINLQLEENGFTFDGTDPYKDPIYKNQSTEQVYNTIYTEAKKNPNQMPKPKNQHVPAEQIEKLIKDALKSTGNNRSLENQKDKAEEDLKNQGNLAGNMAGNIGILLDLSKRKVVVAGATYQEIFKKYLIDPLSGGKRTFMRPNRRQHGKNASALKLPGRFPKRGHLNRLTHLVYALDVSGSITQYQAQQFHDSVRTIKEVLNPEKLTVIFFDTRIVLERTFKDTQPYSKIKVNAGGGTSLTQVFKRTKELKPEALVIFTDLEVSIPPKPLWDCIWLVPGQNIAVPANLYGEVFLIPSKKEN